MCMHMAMQTIKSYIFDFDLFVRRRRRRRWSTRARIFYQLMRDCRSFFFHSRIMFKQQKKNCEHVFCSVLTLFAPVFRFFLFSLFSTAYLSLTLFRYTCKRKRWRRRRHQTPHIYIYAHISIINLCL